MSKCCFLKVVNLDINESVANAGVAGAKRFLSHLNMLDSRHIVEHPEEDTTIYIENHLGLELNVPVYCMTTIP
jgi:hypothetical protein